MFYQDDWKKYIHAEHVTGDPSGGVTRGKFGNAYKFVDFVAAKGVTEPAFTNIGRWRRGQEGERNASVFIPWVFIDIDVEEDVIEAGEQAEQIVRRLLEEGYDLDRVHVSYSGKKGFHVQIWTLQVGRPIFESSIAANIFLKTYTEAVAEDLDWDPASTNPQCLIRLTGSKHGDTGNYKRTWTGRDFLRTSVHARFGEPKKHKPHSFGRGTEINEEARDHFAGVMGKAKYRYRNVMSSTETGEEDKTGNGIIDRLRSGVSEGEEWGDKHFHIGRENAAYVMGCWYLERYAEQMARKKLKGWNRRNDPPLPVSRIESQFRGAKRTIYE